MIPARSAGVIAGPVVWGFLGYPYEVAPMIVGLLACLIVRLYIGFKNHVREAIVIDAIVTALTLLFTAVLILTRRPDPLFALVFGTGIGALGAQVIVITIVTMRSYFKKMGFVILDEDGDAPTAPVRMLKPQSDDEQAIFDAIEKLRK